MVARVLWVVIRELLCDNKGVVNVVARALLCGCYGIVFFFVPGCCYLITSVVHVVARALLCGC